MNEEDRAKVDWSSGDSQTYLPGDDELMEHRLVQERHSRIASAYNSTYGNLNLIVTVEELAELQKALLKYVRSQSPDVVIRKDRNEILLDILEEYFDVLYCLKYVEVLLQLEYREIDVGLNKMILENERRLKKVLSAKYGGKYGDEIFEKAWKSLMKVEEKEVKDERENHPE